MDEARAAEDDREWRRLTLPQRPPLRPVRRWPSERPVATLFEHFLLPIVFISLLVTRPGVAVAMCYLAVWAIAFAAIAVCGRVVARRRARACERAPHEPWRHDRHWDERGDTRSWFTRLAETQTRPGRARFVNALLFMGAVGLATGWTWWAAAVPLCAGATLMAVAVWRLHGAGDAHLAFAKFPFHPGERVTLRFGMGPGGATFQRAEFRLCRVSELALSRRVAPHAGVRTRTLCERRPPGELPGSDFDVEVSFDVPANAGGTKLSGSPPEYWVLDVLAATTSGPYAESFLIPIYERPSAPPDAQAPA